jgi:spermidine/putrescine transport system substrate-binding protein
MGKDVLRVARVQNPKMNRRKFVKLAGGAVGVAVLAAAGYAIFAPKGEMPNTANSTQTTAVGISTQASTTTTGPWGYEGPWVKPVSMYYTGWGGTQQDVVSKIGLQSFSQEYEIKIEEGSFGQDPEIMGKIKAAGGGAWDLVEVDNDTIYSGAVDGLWQPLRLENIPNYKKLPEIFQTNGHGAFDPGYKDGIWHGLPGPMYGTTPMVINTDQVSSVPDSIATLWDGRWKGRMSLEDTWQTRIRAAAGYLGQDANNITDMDAIWKALRDQQKLVFRYWDSGADMEELLTNGEAWIGDLWGGRVLELASRGVHVKAVFPKEGVEAWTDAWVVPINAPHRYEAELLLNWLLEPKIDEAMAIGMAYPPVIDPQYLSADGIAKLKQLPDFVGSDYSKLGFYNDAVWDPHRKDWAETWQTVMAGG